MGSRYGGLKQIDPVGPSGETIMDYSVFDAKQAGFVKIVFVIQRNFEKEFNEQISQKYKKHIPVNCAFQELDDLPANFKLPAHRVKPWGTGHALRAAREVIHEPLAVINADDFYGRSAFQSMAENLNSVDLHRSDWFMIGYKVIKTLSEHGGVNRGICQSENGYLKSIEEIFNIKKEGEIIQAQDKDDKIHTLDPSTPCSMNFFGFTPTIFKILEDSFVKFLESSGQEEKSEFFIPSVVNEIINSNQAQMKILGTDSSWFGMTYKEDKPSVVANIQQMVKNKIYPSPLWV